MAAPDDPDDLSRSVAALVTLVEGRLAPALERIAAALERRGAAPAAEAPGPALAEIRRALREGLWSEAEALAGDFAARFPDAPEVPRIAEEVARGRASAAVSLRARLDAAREAGDPDAVLDLRDALADLLVGDPLRELDRLIAGWLMPLIQRRLRQRSALAAVATLAAHAAESLAATPEGASLRSALPVLRRSAGLCPRCAAPYAGVDDACPVCLGNAEPPAPALAPGTTAEDEGEPPAPTDPDPDAGAPPEPDDLVAEPFDLDRESFRVVGDESPAGPDDAD